MTPAEELRYLILGTQREGNRIFADLLRPLGLTPSQAEALRVVADREPLSLLELGGLLICETGSPSRLVDGLVKAGLVERADDPADRRRVTLSASDAGRTAARGVFEVETQLHQFIEARIPARQLTETIGVLRSLVADRPAGAALDRRRTITRVSASRS
ncbi:MAG TPA: MarR family winged helix-turn-helix transcriptional regulator [Solirubrobacteraceae bacterium]|nr:MarR family winged helix-turn-helix transcriptional regulator [Solirubrobacteraceae bacterium]